MALGLALEEGTMDILRNYAKPISAAAETNWKKFFSPIVARTAIGQLVSPREVESLGAELRSTFALKGPQAAGAWDREGNSLLRAALGDLHSQSQFASTGFGRAEALKNRRKAAGLANPTIGRALAFATSFTPLKHYEGILDNPEALRIALTSNHDEAIGFANFANLDNLGVQSFQEGRAASIAALGDRKLIPDSSMRVIAETLSHALEYQKQSRGTALKNFRAANPMTKLNDEQIAIETGMGPTLHAWFPHVWEKLVKSGMAEDPALAALIGEGKWELDPLGSGTTLLSGSIREILESPKPAQMFEQRFPGLKFAEHETALKNAARASDDVNMYLKLPPKIKNVHNLRRHGMTGWVNDWSLAMEVTTKGAIRHTHLSPLFEPGGSVRKFIDWLNVMDKDAGTAFTKNLASVAGVAPRRNALMSEVGEYGYSLTGLVYKAIVLGWPGIGVPNIAGLGIYGFGEAFRPGLKQGAIDIASSFMLGFDPGFRRWLDELGMRGIHGYDPRATRLVDLTSRASQAMREGNKALAGEYLSEFAVSHFDMIGHTEVQVVKPIAYALGAVRWMRERGLDRRSVHWKDLGEADRVDLWRSMSNTAAKLTILPGASNATPLVRMAHDIPLFGPLSTMFLSTPANIAAQMIRQVRTITALPGAVTPQMRAEAARVFGMTVFGGTMVAGPFWAYPALRELEGTPDHDRLIGMLNAWEQRFSLAGALNVELARRLSPVSGITERFSAFGSQSGGEAVSKLLLGPLGPAAVDTKKALFDGDLEARRKLLGAGSELFDLPRSGVLPTPMHVLMPGAVGMEKFMRIMFPAAQDAQGNLIDASQRATRPAPDATARAKSWFFGSRELQEARMSAEGVSGQKRAEARSGVEKQIRSAILDGNISRALTLYTDNAALSPQITATEVQREELFRALPRQARAVYEMPPREALVAVREALESIRQGGLGDGEAKLKRAIVLAGAIKFRNGVREPQGVILGE